MRLFISVLLLLTTMSVMCFCQDGLKGRKDDYVYVVADNVNVREQPLINSKSLIKLRIGTLVRILNKTNKKEIVNNIKGEWIYIDTLSYNFSNKNETLKGWVFDYYLSNLNGSSRITSFDNYKFEIDLPDHNISFFFKKNGTYIRKPFANETEKKEISGKLYRYKDLIIGKDDFNNDTVSYFIFHLKSDGKLCATEGIDYCVDKNQ